MKNSLFAIVSLILGIFSFVHLLGIEKAVLAVVFGVLALKEVSKAKIPLSPPLVKGEFREITPKFKTFSYIGICLGIIYLVIIVLVLTFHIPQLVGILNKIK